MNRTVSDESSDSSDDDSDVGRYDNKLKRQKLTEDVHTSSDDTKKMSDSTSNNAVSTESATATTTTATASTSNSSVSYTSGRTSDVDATDTKEVSTDSMKVASTNKEYEDTEDSDTDFWLKERYDSEESCSFISRYAMCCLQCKCDTTKKDYYRRFVDPNGLLYMNHCGNSKQSLEQGFGNSYLYHKGCCHGFKATGEDFQSPMQEAIWNSTSQYNIDEYNKLKEAEAKPLSDLIQSLKTARIKQVTRDNLEDDTPDALKQEGKTLEMYKLETSQDFREVKVDFQKRMEEKTMDHSLVVFDLFSGIGSATVVLKKLQLPIKTMLHVEHDPVANYVSQSNHKDDGIQHVYIETFESVYGYGDENSCDKERLRKWIEKYGPIDLVVAGAPCQNYSEVNAFCDREKQNAKYLLQVGTLIKTINEIQVGKKPVLFMSENVVFRKYDDIMKKYSDVTSNGLPPVKIDAQDFSPMVRNRYYWTNMPPDTLEDIDAKYRATPHELLDEGWSMAARAYSSWEEMECLTLKANTSMASKGRIDDMRMTKIKETEVGRFIKSTYSVLEREKMMGLPIDYVSKPMKELFNQLAMNGFYFPETEEGTTYKTWLDQSLWHFVKKCQFRVKNKIGEHPYFQIEVSAPQEGKKSINFYDEEEYCKRLIGNGWSIVVVEHILKGIKEMYPSKNFFRQYQGFNYTFPWPPYNEWNQQNNAESQKEQNEKVNEDNVNMAITNDCTPKTTESISNSTQIINNEQSATQEEDSDANSESNDGGAWI